MNTLHNRFPQALIRRDGSAILRLPPCLLLDARLGAIPPSGKRYLGGAEIWLIAPEHTDMAIRAVQSAYPDARLIA